jgi:uncharacterized membrane protein (DUF373 family)
MDNDDHLDREAVRFGGIAARLFKKMELITYIVLGLLLVLTALLGIGNACASLWSATRDFGNVELVIITIDRLLFVLMLVEILHTVRDSFSSGTLVCEPFLVVGLIASIRRVLSITLQSSQASELGHSSPATLELLHSTMVELIILGGLILVMVVSICLLRLSKRNAARP